MKFAFGLTAATLCFATSLTPALAADAAYPTKPVQVIVPYAPGGNPDVLTRLLAEKLGARMGQAFVVDNRSGAGGNIGAERLVSSAPDGYTLGVLDSAQTAINPALYRKLPYSVKDMDPIMSLVSVPTLLVVSPAIPARTVAELVAWANSQPKKLTYGSAGNGSIHHLTAAMFASATGTTSRLIHVPYRGSSQIVPALLSGEVDFAFVGVPVVKPYLESKRLRALGISTAQRSKMAPEIPTLAEGGVRNFDVSAVIGLFAPHGTPDAVKNEVRTNAFKVLADKEMQAKLSDLGMELMALTPDEYAQLLHKEREKYARAVQESGMRVE